MSIGSNIYELRKQNKLTQSYLAEKLGVPEQAISKWENEVCAPDVSLFPAIATVFSVSIDRIFGFHLAGYSNEVEEIMKAADDSRDTYKEIEIISEGLKRYPNSPELKIYLAFSLSMVNRFSKNEEEKKNSILRAIALCNEVVDTCGDEKQVDEALNMLRRIYVDIKEYEKALCAVEKMSADNFCGRVRGKAAILAKIKNFSEFLEFLENNLWNLFFAMDKLLENTAQAAQKNENFQCALAFLSAREKLLSVFDDGCVDFYIAHKIEVCQTRAKIFMNLKDKEKCLNELRNLSELARRERIIPKNTDYHISARNPMYFGSVEKDLFEENFIDFRIEPFLSKFDGFFGDDMEYSKMKNEAIK